MAPLVTLVSAEFCLEEGCYQFRIEDDYEDGICCDYGEGSWTILDPNGMVVGHWGTIHGCRQPAVLCRRIVGTASA